MAGMRRCQGGLPVTAPLRTQNKSEERGDDSQSPDKAKPSKINNALT
jgi:hypothetical protein